jgi:putative acetyltransferase
MQPVLRPIQQSDDAQLAKLIKSVLAEFKANKPGTAYFDESTNHLSTLFTNPNSAYWVCEEEGKIIGAGGIYPTEGLPVGTCELVKLYLYPEARGRGLGKILMQKCFEQAKLLGYQNIYLETMPELNQAVNMYHALGFKSLSCALGNSGHFGCDIWMVKEL